MLPSDVALKTAALDALQIGVVVHGADTSVIYCNASAARYLGLTVDQMLGRVAMDPHWCLYDEDGQPMRPQDYPVSRVAHGRAPVSGMLLGVDDTSCKGRIRWLLVNAMPVFRDADELDFIVVDFSDITERRRLEIELENERNKHRVMLRNASDGMCILDARGLVEEASDSWVAQLGYTREEVLGMHVSQWDAGMDAAAVDRIVASVIAGGQRVQFETRHRSKDGTVRDVEVSVVPFEFDQRPLIFCSTRDISARKRAELLLEEQRQGLEDLVAHRTSELTLALAEAQSANRAKSLFLSSMSHELRTPLHAISGYAELLLSDEGKGLDASQRAQALQIQSSGEHLVALVADVLDLARIDSGELEVVLEPVALEAMLEMVAASVAPMAAKAGVAVEIRQPDTPCWVMADPRRLRQCLTNLVSNGIKYNRRGGQVRILARSEGDSGVAIDVEDTGRGLSERQQDHLFERFNRLGAEASDIVGSGIGLVITRQLLAQMRGRISVRSRVGEGSTFSIWLPAGRAPTAHERPAPTASHPAGDPDEGGPLEVLYVEDNQVNGVLMMAMATRRPRVHLRIARTGDEGLQALRAHPARLVLIDMNLGDCDGIELHRRMRAELPDADRVHVAASADASQEKIDSALASGFSRYLTKPIRLEVMLALFDEFLARSAQG